MGFTIMILFGPLIFTIILIELFAILLNRVLTAVLAVALAINGLFFLVLLVFRNKWKAIGRMEPEFIDSYTGWQHYALLGVKLLLTWGAAWEALATAACALLLSFHPWTSLI